MTLTEIVDRSAPEGTDYGLVTTEAQLDELIAEMWKAPLIGLDTETEGLLFTDIIVGLCISVRPGHGRYIPLRHTLMDVGVRAPNQLEPKLVFEKLKAVLEAQPCTGHNIKFDLKMFWKEGVDPNFVHDTMIQAHLLGFPRGFRGLKPLVKSEIDYDMAPLETLFPKTGRTKPKIEPAKLQPTEIEQYGCEDGDYSLQLCYKLLPRLQSVRGLGNVYGVEMALLRVVAEMEMHGVPTSKSFLEGMKIESGELLARLGDELQAELREAVGDPEMEPVNINSPKQLGELIYDKLGMPCKVVTESGNRSTAGAVLEDLAKEYPIMERILTFRLLYKLHGTFLKKMMNIVHDDGRIRGNFNQVGTETGRFSSSDPNLQNIPKDQIFNLWVADDKQVAIDSFPEILRVTEDCDPMLEPVYEAYSDEASKWGDYYLGTATDGKQYSVHHGKIYEAWKCKTRQFITASPGHYIAEFDYSQVELRILAAEAQEPTFLDAFAKGDDVHSRTAAAIYNVPFENVTKLQRGTGKTINFGLLYGMGPQKLAQSLGITMDEAKATMERYFVNLPNIKTWITRVKAEARMDGYAQTSFGRRRELPMIKSNDNAAKAMSEREAANHHIQGAAADIMKIALVRLHNMMRKYYGGKVRIVCTVHDSVILEVDESIDPAQVVMLTQKAMEFAPAPAMLPERVAGPWPLLGVDGGVGPDWAHSLSLKELGIDPHAEMPEPVDPSTLPQFFTRLVALEREGGEAPKAQAAPEPDPEPSVELVAEQAAEPTLTVNPETGEVTEGTPQSDVPYAWLLEVSKISTKDQITRLQAYLKTKYNPNSETTLVILYPNADGVTRIPMPGTFNLGKENEVDLRLILGPCKLKQDLESMDPEEIAKNLSFGLS